MQLPNHNELSNQKRYQNLQNFPSIYNMKEKKTRKGYRNIAMEIH